MGLERQAFGQSQLHRRQHGPLVVLQTQEEDIDHLTIAVYRGLPVVINECTERSSQPEYFIDKMKGKQTPKLILKNLLTQNFFVEIVYVSHVSFVGNCRIRTGHKRKCRLKYYTRPGTIYLMARLLRRDNLIFLFSIF